MIGGGSRQHTQVKDRVTQAGSRNEMNFVTGLQSARTGKINREKKIDVKNM